MVNNDGHYTICEVFYDDDGKIQGWAEDCSPFGENLGEIRSDITMMVSAFDRDILVESEIMSSVIDNMKDNLEKDND